MEQITKKELDWGSPYARKWLKEIKVKFGWKAN